MEDYCLIQAFTFWPQKEKQLSEGRELEGAEKSPSAPQPWHRGQEYIWESNWAKAASPILAWGIRMASTQSRNLVCKLSEKQSTDCSPHTQPAQIQWQKHRLCFWKGTVTMMKNYSQLGQESVLSFGYCLPTANSILQTAVLCPVAHTTAHAWAFEV